MKDPRNIILSLELKMFSLIYMLLNKKKTTRINKYFLRYVWSVCENSINNLFHHSPMKHTLNAKHPKVSKS